MNRAEQIEENIRILLPDLVQCLRDILTTGYAARSFSFDTDTGGLTFFLLACDSEHSEEIIVRLGLDETALGNIN